MTRSVVVGLDELRLRASLLSHYELSWIGAGDEGEALFADSTRVLVGDMRHWALDDAVRRSVTSRMPLSELQRAWRSLVHRPSDDRQRAIDRVVGGLVSLRLDELSPAEVRALAWLSRWLGGHLRRTDEINRAVALTGLLEPLRDLADNSFVGREDLLFRLRAHLDDPGQPLLFHGIGGIGKSALLARHVLRSVSWARVCYLNFDQTSLDPAVPATVVAAIAGQLAMQTTNDGGRTDQLLAGARDQLRGGDKHYQSSGRSANIGSTHTNLLRLLELALQDGPTLLVLDTFEEVQRRSPEVQESFAAFIADLAHRIPNLSIVAAGRSPAVNLGFNGIEVPLFTSAEATALLRSLLPFNLSIADARRVIDAVRASPLCIRLAAGILRKQPAHDAFRDITLRLGVVEGELYHRLLSYIENPLVRKLAHPGLTLRRVTPELIEEVLSRPCRVPVPHPGAAHALFEELAREAMLVDRMPDGHVLVHRSDVRQMMLPRLTADDPRTIATIHRRAIAYYRRRTGTTARTEELYHRLMLGQQRATLERCWDDDALPGLIPSLDELPPASKVYLATKTEYLGVSEEDLLAADLTDRREQVLRRVRKLFQERMFERALTEIEEHRSESGDLSCPVTDLLVQVLEASRQWERALFEAETGRNRVTASGSPQDFYTLTFHVIRLHEHLGNLHGAQQEAAKALLTTDSAPPTIDFRLVRLRLVLHCLRLARRGVEPTPFTSNRLARDAIRLYNNMSTRAIRDVPGLLRDLAGEIGDQEPKILRAALQVYGLDARDIPELLTAFGTEAPESLTQANLSEFTRYPFADRLADQMATGPLPRRVPEALAELYRQDADDALSGGADIEFVQPSVRQAHFGALDEPELGAHLRAEARSLVEQGRHRQAISVLNRAVEEAGNDTAARAMALASLAYLEAETKGFDQGLSRILQAKELSPSGPTAAMVDSQHALILLRAGQTPEALKQYDLALAGMVHADVSPPMVVRAMFNRGLARIEMGDVEGAGRDLSTAAVLAEEHDLPVVRGKALANLGVIAQLTADLPTALAQFEQAARILHEANREVLARIRLDVAEAKLAAGLADNANDEIRDLLPDLRQGRAGFDVAVAEHRLAAAEFLRGEFQQAEVHATAARRRFTRRGHDRWAALATLTRLRAQVAMITAGDRPARRDTQERAADLADRLATLGLADEAAVANLLAARIAIVRQALDDADRLLQRSTLRPSAPIDCRMLQRLCRAELAVVHNDPPTALDEARRGFAELANYPDRLGTLDLPTGTAVSGRALADLAVNVARSRGDTKLLEWLERAKAPIYGYDPRPVDEPRARLRTISRLRQRHLLEGRPVNELDSRFGQLRPIAGQSAPWVTSRAALTKQLGDRVLVSLGTSRGELFAVVLHGKTVTVPLCSTNEAFEAAIRLHADLDTLAPDELATPLVSMARTSATHRSESLDRLIVQPLLPLISDRELLICPTGPLESVAWGALPSLRGRPVSVTPSASLWLRITESERDNSATMLGPHVQTVTMAEAKSAIDGRLITDLVARFVSTPENPWLSGHDWASGELRAYEFASLTHPPKVVITEGDLGYAGALLQAGVRTVVIAVGRIADTVRAAAAHDLYRLITAGRPIARAVADTTARDPLKRPFVCVGA
ncbi:MAG TPA: hypothetical protein VFV67_00415 [Actinophytocola sp.]|uniref:hypothetical protein n=1 Tax=Actinophytocola sp. TaxID=1872138 RepID=UPI002DB839E5|nr:hypothetical protein [Actinophytocola sp.]HEU5469085.1 hypothetical protein [Actinophytocola sp.]